MAWRPFRWLSRSEKATFFFLMLAIAALNGMNAAFQFGKLIDAQENPATATSLRPLSVDKTNVVGVFCSPDPESTLDDLRCTRTVLNTTSTRADTTFLGEVVPCRAEPVTSSTFAFPCVAIPDLFNVGDEAGAYFSYSVIGTLSSCKTNASVCSFELVYLFVTEKDKVDQLFAESVQLSSLQSIPLPGFGVSFIHLSNTVTRKLNGDTSRTYAGTASVVSKTDRDGTSIDAVSFVIDINTFSWSTTEQLSQEYLYYDTFDLLSSISAIASISVAFFTFVWPSSPRLPFHFRFGRFYTARNLEHVAQSQEDLGLVPLPPPPTSNRVAPLAPTDDNDSYGDDDDDDEHGKPAESPPTSPPPPRSRSHSHHPRSRRHNPRSHHITHVHNMASSSTSTASLSSMG